MKRPSFDQIYMGLALALSKRSTCERAQVGCVVVSADNNQVLAVGYNGNFRGGKNGCDSDEPGLCGCLHAEDNCMIKLDFNGGIEKKLYTTTLPCKTCAKRIVNARISRVIYLRDYRLRDGLKILKKAKVKVSRMEERAIRLLEDGKD